MAKINWINAKTDYVTDETQSYASIAKKYGVSDVAVENHAKHEEWQESRRKSLVKVGEILVEKKVKTIAEINAQNEQIGENIVNLALNAIQDKDYRPKNFRSAVSAIKIGIDIRRKARGMDIKDIKDNKDDKFSRVEAFIEESRKKYGFGKYSEEPKKVITPTQPIKKEVVFVDTLPLIQDNRGALNTPTTVLTPQFLEEIKMKLNKIQEGYANLVKKTNTPIAVQPEARYGWLSRN